MVLSDSHVSRKVITIEHWDCVFHPFMYSKKLINTQVGFELLCLKMRALLFLSDWT